MRHKVTLSPSSAKVWNEKNGQLKFIRFVSANPELFGEHKERARDQAPDGPVSQIPSYKLREGAVAHLSVSLQG